MLREMLGFAFEAGMLMESSRQGIEASRQSAISRQLAGWAATWPCRPPSPAFFNGMNFDTPDFHWRFGYYSVILAGGGGLRLLFIRFRRAGWI